MGDFDESGGQGQQENDERFIFNRDYVQQVRTDGNGTVRINDQRLCGRHGRLICRYGYSRNGLFKHWPIRLPTRAKRQH